MNEATQSLTKADRIEGAIDKKTTGELAINRHGQVTFVNANEIMEFAKMMAIAKQAIPPHLRDNPGGCMAVCIQASSWQMSPFAVANKSYVVNDRMAYEAQIIAAVILMRAPIKGRLKYTYQGKDTTRQCTCTAVLDDGDPVEYQTPEIRNIKVQNSPLWKNDPDQQLAYSAARSLARRHFPDVILGVYTPDEMAEETLPERDVTPDPAKPKFLHKPEQTKAQPAITEATDGPSFEEATPSNPWQDPGTGEAPGLNRATEEIPSDMLRRKLDEAEICEEEFMAYMVKAKMATPGQTWSDLAEKKFAVALKSWDAMVAVVRPPAK